MNHNWLSCPEEALQAGTPREWPWLPQVTNKVVL